MGQTLQFQGISENLKYVFTNRGILPLSECLDNSKKVNFIEYSYENLHLAVDILKEHKELYYKLDMISLLEYSNSSRKFLYQILEIFKPENQIEVIREWEEHFGNKLLLINESVDKLLIEQRVNESWESIKSIIYEAWYNPLSWDWKGGAQKAAKWVGDQAKSAVDWTKEQGKQIKDKGLVQWGVDKAKSVWSTVKDAVSKAYKCLTNNFVECLMEGLRSAAFSAVGMGVMVGVGFIPGVGQIADVIVFGSLLIWDIYKALSGKYESGQYQWSFADIVVDAVCVLLPALGAGVKVAMRGIRSAGELGIAAAKQGGILAKAVNLLRGGLSKLISVIGKSATFIGEKLGLKTLSNFGAKAESFMTKTVNELGGQTTKTVEKKSLTQKAASKLSDAKKGVSQFAKDFKFTKPVPVVAKSTGKTILITGALCSALGLDGWTCMHKIESGEVSKEELARAQAAISSGEFQKQLGQMTVQDAESIGLF